LTSGALGTRRLTDTVSFAKHKAEATAAVVEPHTSTSTGLRLIGAQNRKAVGVKAGSMVVAGAVYLQGERDEGTRSASTTIKAVSTELQSNDFFRNGNNIPASCMNAYIADV
jgi:hypothetical protein